MLQQSETAIHIPDLDFDDGSVDHGMTGKWYLYSVRQKTLYRVTIRVSLTQLNSSQQATSKGGSQEERS